MGIARFNGITNDVKRIVFNALGKHGFNQFVIPSDSERSRDMQ